MSGCVDSTVYIIFIDTVVGVKRTSSGWVLGEEEERELEDFVKKSVTGNTMKKYSYGWMGRI